MRRPITDCPHCGSTDVDWIDEWTDTVVDIAGAEATILYVEYCCNGCATIFSVNEADE